MSFEHAPKANIVDTSFRSGGMIGMLDYRASKLYRLLVFPIRIAARVVEIAVIAFCVIITGYWSSALAKRASELRKIQNADIYGVSITSHIIIGVLFAAICLFILGLLWNILILGGFNKLFLFFIDVVPSEGRSYSQAHAVVQSGDKTRLLLKMEYPEAWTDSDTNEYVKRLSLIVRLMYGDRIRRRMPEMIAILDKAKRDGVNLSTDTLEIKRRLQPLNDAVSKEERLVSNWVVRQNVRLVAVFIACLVIYYK